MKIWRQCTSTGLAALAALAAPVSGQDPYADAGYVDDGAYQDAAYYVADSLEARVWLDRGDEPVVEWGDEVRVYYRTSDDAYAAIFRIDTDGRISLLYPQHPDADPYVVGGRDYRLVFREGPRWKVREDPGVGYFFMVASQQPLDFSLFGFDADEGWDLRGVGETVYEDPYVAIDDYVAAVLPDWETTPYALDFLEYSVGEKHDYPRFLCYDCHTFRSYSRWDPYARACSSYQVVIWDDPYFYPRFRYVGTRVVFARPLGPRPRYSVTARLVGSGPRPIVRSRPAPPRRTAVFKESPRRGSSLFDVPRSRVGPVPDRGLAPSRSRPSAGVRGSSLRRSPPAATQRGLPSAADRARPSARRGVPPDARSRGTAASSQRPSLPPSARRGAPAEARSGSGERAGVRERPTLQRRPPSAARREPARPPSARAPARPPRSGAGAAPTRPRRPGGGAAPSRGPGPGSSAGPSRPPPSGPGAASSRPRRPGGAATSRPPRPRGSAGPSRPPRSGSGAASPRPRRPGGGAAPSRPPPPRGSAGPSRPPRSGSGASSARPRRPGGTAGPTRAPRGGARPAEGRPAPRDVRRPGERRPGAGGA